MKKNNILIFFGLLFLFYFSTNSFAMPPHPSVYSDLENKGQLDVLESIQKAQNNKGMNKAVRTFPTTGHNNVLVILIQFSDLKFSNQTSLYTKSPGILPGNSGFSDSGILSGFALFWSMLLFIFIFLLKKRRKKGQKIGYKLALLINTVFLIFSLTGCSNPIDFFDNSTTAFYDNLFESSTYSWKQYYLDMSYGALSLAFDVVGPFNASNDYVYYGQNINDSDRAPATLVGEAIDLAEKNGVDFSKYDNDSDGYVDSVVVIHAGPGEEATVNGIDYIWSHRWDLYSAAYYGDGTGYRTYDNVYINDYSIQPEYVFYAGDSTIGVFAHEFGHLLGLPDLYDTSGQTDGIGNFTLMASGSWLGPNGKGGRPAPLTAWERYYLGWLTALEMNAGNVQNNISLYDSLSSQRNTLKLTLNPGDTGLQYLVFEFMVKKSGTWTEYTPAPLSGGLIVYRVDEAVFVNPGGNDYSGYGPNDSSYYHHGVEIVEADNQWELWNGDDSNYGEAEDFFTGSGPEIITPSTSPNTNYYSASDTGHSPTLSSGVSVDLNGVYSDYCSVDIY